MIYILVDSMHIVLKIAFVCIHNSCRSQIAEALCKRLASDVFECYSAGTNPGSEIDPIATKLVSEHFGVDMASTQHPKTLSEIPSVDIVVTMGCIDGCPAVYCDHHEDWGLPDPSGGSEDEYLTIIRRIENCIVDIRTRAVEGRLNMKTKMGRLV